MKDKIKLYEQNILEAEALLNELPEKAFGWQSERELNERRDFLVRIIETNKYLIEIRNRRMTAEMIHLTS